VLRLVLRTQPRSGPFAIGGSAKMRPVNAHGERTACAGLIGGLDTLDSIPCARRRRRPLERFIMKTKIITNLRRCALLIAFAAALSLSPVFADGEGGAKKTGPRDGEGGVKKGPRDVAGGVKKGPRDGEGGVKRGPREGDVPRTGSAETGRGTSMEGKIITIVADNRGRMVSGEGQAMATAQMREQLRRIVASANGRKVLIRADQGMSAAAIQSLIKECQSAGIKNLFLSPPGR